VDCKEWHEAYVSQFHRSGKHLVQFRISSESKWLNMTKVVFYIVERPTSMVRGNGEYKDNDVGLEDYLAPVEVCVEQLVKYLITQCRCRMSGFTLKK
jgi:hypothetical protein